MLEALIKEMILGDFKPREKGLFGSDNSLKELRRSGTELWLDTGDLDEASSVWKDEFSALTTNNTLVNQVVQKGIFDELINDSASTIRKEAPHISEAELILEVGFILNCRTAMRLIEVFGCKVSVELHPEFSSDIDKTLYYAKRYYSICPDKFIIKIPLTPEGYIATRRLSEEDIPVNFTLGFSARQNYLAAVIANPSYVNVFMGRLNQVVKENGFGDGLWVGEKATAATQRALNQAKARYPGIKTRLIGASIRDGAQMTALAGIDVFTAPPKAVKELIQTGIPEKGLKKALDREFEPVFKQKPISGDTGFDILWDIEEDLKEAIDELASSFPEDLTGKGMVEFFESRSPGMFQSFAEKDISLIRKKGKIPDLSLFQGRSPVDYLMTVSALEAFRKDQYALDGRIAQKIKGQKP